MLGAYALDAVEPEEAAALERHLPTCPRCRNELAEHREAAALLGYAAGGAAPSGIWDRIIASLEEPPPALLLTRVAMPPPPAPIAPGVEVPTGEIDHDVIAGGWGPKTPPSIHARTPQVSIPWSDHRAPVVPIGQAPRRRSVEMRFLVALATAAAVIVAALGIEVGRLQVHKSQPTANLAAFVYQAAEATPDARHLTLTSPDGVHTVAAIIVPGGKTYLGPNNLSTLPSSETYQMWGDVDGAQVSLGVIGDNPTYTSFTTPAVADSLAMTVEQRGGVVISSKAPVVDGAVPNA